MRLLANENFPGLAVETLRRLGHDVAWVRQDAPGSSDRQVIARATAEDRLLLTLDKDFGELAFHAGLPASSGVVLVRVVPPTPARVTRLVERLFSAHADLRGEFVVLQEDRIRRRPIPECK
jgi:predicted nuclease of predicted toxin-antitoxin system